MAFRNSVSFCSFSVPPLRRKGLNAVSRTTRMLSSGTATCASVYDLDRSVFAQRWQVFALPLPPKLCQGTIRALKDHVLRVPRVAAVLKSSEVDSKRVVLLRYFAEPPPDVPFSPRGNMDLKIVGDVTSVSEKLRSVSQGPKISDEVAKFLRDVHENDIIRSKVELSYEHWPIEAVLKYLLPKGTTVPSAYETVGHIVHLNLREEQLPYKAAIGTVLLDKLKPRIRTVVNKTESTGGPYRTFLMEVLAGDPSTETSLKENGCTFKLDFSRVYWNSRLETEHGRIANSLKSSDILADAFCGIGPFALPSFLKRKCKVYANDLNPASVEYLELNARANGVSLDTDSNFQISCACARDFLRRLVSQDHVPITRVVMNFPSGAPEFLDVFRGLYSGLEHKGMPMPFINCYCFARGDDWEADAQSRVYSALSGSRAACKDLDLVLEVREVRDVAPKKRHVCVTFQLPSAIAYEAQAGQQHEHCSLQSSPAPKRPRVQVSHDEL